MRIVHIITRLIIGGAQENTVLNCEDLVREHGDDVLLLTGPSTGPEGSLMRRAGLGVFSCTVVPTLIRPIRPLADYRAYRQIKRIVHEFKPDVVHTHSAKAGVLGRLAARAAGVPAIVHSVHGAPFWPDQHPLVRAFYTSCERYVAKRCDAFLCVAEAMADLMAAARVAPRERFTTVYSGMEIEPFLESAKDRKVTRDRLGFADEHVVVGKIARLFELKGHEYVIEAAGRIVRECPHVRFLFVGDGVLAERHRREIARRELTQYFTFTGLVQPEHIPAHIAAMDIVVHTSLREGLARVLPQGLLVGKPVVSFDVDGAREVVIDGETGFLLPPKSVESLATAVIRLANDPERRGRFGAEGRRRFAQQFDHRFMTRRIREIYLEVLEGKRG